jgi:hypothetical protein
MDEQTTTTIYEPPVYEPPVLVELGEFGEDTLGHGTINDDHVIGMI